MLNKYLKSSALLLLFLSSTCLAANEQKETYNIGISEKTKNFNIMPIIESPVVKYLFPTALTLITGGIVCLQVRKSKLDKILEQDLDKDMECNIVHYFDKEKISLEKDEIRRYSAAYHDFLSKLGKDNRVKEEKIYDKLKACALFLIRTDARLKRINKELTYETFIKETERYRNKKDVCILSKSFFENNSNNSEDIEDPQDYLYYYYDTPVDSLNITMHGKDKRYGGWCIVWNTEKLELDFFSAFDVYNQW